MADKIIRLSIPEAKILELIDANEIVYPVPKKENGTRQYTKAQWFKICLRNYLKSVLVNAESIQRAQYVSNLNVDDVSIEEE